MTQKNVTIEFLSDDDGQRPSSIAQAVITSGIEAAVSEHPFYSRRVAPPPRLAVAVLFGEAFQTAIDHSAYSIESRICLQLNEFYFRLNHSGLADRLIADDGTAHEALRRLLFHEFGHFIDARLDRAFSYSDHLRPTDRSTLTLHHHLWDCHIDGRLGAMASHSLAERIAEAKRATGLPADVIRQSWSGAFPTYPIIVQQAQTLREAGFVLQDVGSLESRSPTNCGPKGKP